MKKLAVFDLDGTLINSLKDLYLCLNQALKECGLPFCNENEVKSYIGDGVAKLVERSVGERQDKKDECLTAFKRIYNQDMLNQTRPFDGVRKMLEGLKSQGVKVAVISNKYDEAVKKITQYFFSGLIDIAIGQKDGLKIKPDPTALNTLICDSGLTKNEVVLIGDGEADVYCALNAGIDFIGASWGYRHYTLLQKAGAKIFANSPQDVLQIINTL